MVIIRNITWEVVVQGEGRGGVGDGVWVGSNVIMWCGDPWRYLSNQWPEMCFIIRLH